MQLYKSNFVRIDNDKHLDDKEARHKFAPLVKKYANKWAGGPIKNPIGKQWVKDQLKLKKAGVK